MAAAFEQRPKHRSFGRILCCGRGAVSESVRRRGQGSKGPQGSVRRQNFPNRPPSGSNTFARPVLGPVEVQRPAAKFNPRRQASGGPRAPSPESEAQSPAFADTSDEEQVEAAGLGTKTTTGAAAETILQAEGDSDNASPTPSALQEIPVPGFEPLPAAMGELHKDELATPVPVSQYAAEGATPPKRSALHLDIAAIADSDSESRGTTDECAAAPASRRSQQTESTLATACDGEQEPLPMLLGRTQGPTQLAASSAKADKPQRNHGSKVDTCDSAVVDAEGWRSCIGTERGAGLGGLGEGLGRAFEQCVGWSRHT